ncbi:MAG: LemA family protein [Clostridia bacterium]|nr:LemA family protein [Clostridia bacterium]
MTALWIVLGIVAAAAVIIIIWAVHAYNKFIRLSNDIDEAASTIQVFEKKRSDLIPNVVSAVKGYAAHETEIFDSVTKARERVLSAPDEAARQKSEEELGGALSRLLAVAEAYPDLKANTNFLNLQNQLEQIESEIASARRYYNANVKLYNTRLQTWPTSIIARRQGFTRRPLYEVPDPGELQNVKVAF